MSYRFWTRFRCWLMVWLFWLPMLNICGPAVAQTVSNAPILQGFAKSEVHMGVRFQISLYAADEAVAEQAFAAGFAEIARLERIFSDYQPASETRQIDAAPCETKIPLSNDMRRLLEMSRTLNRNSNGYFDVTLGKLTKLWRVARREKQPPSSEAIAFAAERVGFDRLEVCTEYLLKRTPGVELDFGGIAKGDAADQVLRLLKDKLEITKVLIDASGDLVAGDPPPGQKGWVVGLSRPADDPGPMTRVYLANRALASSGDSTQFLETDQARWSHLIDPHTKTPILGQNLTLVWADDGATSDALASALAICPPEQMPEIAARFPTVAACVYRRRDLETPTEVLQTENWTSEIRKNQVEANQDE
ncbi:MAG: FAD:protein FMN transferase [Planctomycetaceae bacterium]|nr:FAD:protein FMN transferase [Planctomycetaceae bacterium]